jgi:translation initiation factor IF-2
VAEEWGGTTTMVQVSAKKGTGMEDLLQVRGEWRRSVL